MQAPGSGREAERLNALAEYQLLDTQFEESYDNITALASYICECPISIISLVDESRQWFKSRVGIETRETPRELAFCAHAILKPDQMTVVADAELDNRFADNPLVLGDPHIRFYAGVPLNTPGGHALGTLCVIDAKPRTLTDAQSRALQALARQVTALFELKRTSLAMAHTLEKIRVLEAFLPICAGCKAIRDSADRWHRVEDYLKAEAEVQLTHSMCPVCAEALLRKL